jgi:hypothetical protein
MYNRVPVPLDGSPLAESVIPFILQIAGPLDLEVLLVRVVELTALTVVEATRQVIVEDVAALRDPASTSRRSRGAPRAWRARDNRRPARGSGGGNRGRGAGVGR